MWHCSSVFGTCPLLWVLPYPLALSKSSVIICWIRLIFQSLYTQITQLFGLHMSLNVEKVWEVQTQWGIHQIWSVGVFCFTNYEPVFSSVSNEKPDIWLIFLKNQKIFLNMSLHSHMAPIAWNWVVAATFRSFVMVPTTPLWVPDIQASCQFCLSPCTIFLIEGKYFSGKAGVCSGLGHGLGN